MSFIEMDFASGGGGSVKSWEYIGSYSANTNNLAIPIPSGTNEILFSFDDSGNGWAANYVMQLENVYGQTKAMILGGGTMSSSYNWFTGADIVGTKLNKIFCTYQGTAYTTTCKVYFR